MLYLTIIKLKINMDRDLSNTIGKIKSALFFKNKSNLISTKKSLDRLPPGQHLLKDPTELPILDLGNRPDFDPVTYKFEVSGLVQNPVKLSYEQLKSSFPKLQQTSDFHCVTRWSQYDVTWAGFSFTALENLVKPLPEAQFIIQFGLDDYSTNAPLSQMRKPNVLLAYELRSMPLSKEHGWPLRLINPYLYGWKGAKFLTKIKYVAKDDPGFWEVRGYHNTGDPWQEQRYS